MYPNLIVDNFFEDPDSIVDLSTNLQYSPSDNGRWPGLRSNYLHKIYPRLFDFISTKITHLFYDTCESWTYEITFQKINPYSENQYNKKNCGWVHSDEYNFGGVIFLTKNQEEEIKNRHFLGGIVDDDIFNQFYNTYHNQFEETIKIKNIYNRLVLFNSGTLHAVQTYGTKERLTIPFFNSNISNKLPPLYR